MLTSQETQAERLYDAYLDAALAGDLRDPVAFCQERGITSGEAVEWVRGLHDVLVGNGPAERERRPLLVAEANLPFDRLGEFRLIRQLGEGGMGRVFLAEQESLGRLVALKLIRPELAGLPTIAERFVREARAIACLRHPHVVQVYRFGNDQGVRFLAMEFVPGKSMRELLVEASERGERIPIPTLVRWILGVAEALECAHAQGILHRDVKPSNVRITPDGDALLLDFGLARQMGADITTITSSFAGSPAYAAPEQIKDSGSVDPRTDVYSLGITLYEGLTGRAAFQGDLIPLLLNRVLLEDPAAPRKIVSSISRDLETVCLKAIEKDAARRYATADEFAKDLRAVLDLQPVSARRAGPLRLAAKWARRHRVMVAASILVLLSTLAVTGTQLWQGRSNRLAAKAEAADLVTDAFELLHQHEIDQAHFEKARWSMFALEEASLHRWMDPAEQELLREHWLTIDAHRSLTEQVFPQIVSLLSQAQRLDAEADRMQEALAFYYYQKFLELRGDHGQRETAWHYRNLVLQTDPGGEWSKKVEGRAGVSIQTTPPGAQIYLFAVRPQADLVPAGEHRLVPCPLTSGGAMDRSGTWVLRVVEARAGLRVNDLVLELAGHPIEGCVLVANQTGEADLFDRLVAVDGHPIRGLWDVEHIEATAGMCVFTFERPGKDGRYDVEGEGLHALGIEVSEPRAMVKAHAVPALLWNGGDPRATVLPAGLEVRTTAAPMLLSPQTLLGTSPIPMQPLDPGEYRALIRLEGFEDQTVSFHVDHTVEEYSSDLAIAVQLRSEGTTPLGFRFIAMDAFPWGIRPCWILDHEVTNADYLVFLNASDTDGERHVPRFPVGLNRSAPWPHVAGRYELPAEASSDDPVLGVSWYDARAFARWTGERMDVESRGLECDLPTEDEWSWAANGGETRSHAYGHRFTPRWNKGLHARPEAGPEPVFSFPIDESPYGVFDLGGSASEWLSDPPTDAGEGMGQLAGGAWDHATRESFLLATRHIEALDSKDGSSGFRLALRRMNR